jgi:IS4 transposase
MANCSMAKMLPRYVSNGVEPSSRVEELEARVEKLEKLVERLVKSNKPSFQDFKFIKDDEDKVKMEEMECSERRRNRTMSMNAMFRNDR